MYTPFFSNGALDLKYYIGVSPSVQQESLHPQTYFLRNETLNSDLDVTLIFPDYITTTQPSQFILSQGTTIQFDIMFNEIGARAESLIHHTILDPNIGGIPDTNTGIRLVEQSIILEVNPINVTGPIYIPIFADPYPFPAPPPTTPPPTTPSTPPTSTGGGTTAGGGTTGGGTGGAGGGVNTL